MAKVSDFDANGKNCYVDEICKRLIEASQEEVLLWKQKFTSRLLELLGIRGGELSMSTEENGKSMISYSDGEITTERGISSDEEETTWISLDLNSS